VAGLYEEVGMAMKRYVGEPFDKGMGGQVIVISDEDSRYLLPHHMLHSPDGFAWGYHGSGPSELARCLLWDVLGHAPEKPLYHKFKSTFIAPLSRNAEWSLDESAIWDWLQAQGVVE
jgi:hypothetical protein